MKTFEENPCGYHCKYIVTKANGEQCDPAASYFVLRIDGFCDDPIWTRLCREAVAFLAKRMLEEKHLEQLAQEILDELTENCSLELNP